MRTYTIRVAALALASLLPLQLACTKGTEKNKTDEEQADEAKVDEGASVDESETAQASGEEASVDESETAQASDEVAGEGWPEEVRKGYLSQCKDRKMPEAFCECSLRRLEDKIPWEEAEPVMAEAMDANPSSAEEVEQIDESVAQRFAEAMTSCQQEHAPGQTPAGKPSSSE